MTADTTQQSLKQLSFGFGLIGLCCGFLSSYAVLAGDGEGRVNLLFVLLLFAFVPVMSLLLSLILIARGGGKGFAGWLLDLPLWPRHLTLALPQLNLFHGRQSWFFYQTQILSLSFGVGCILLYLLLLLGSDISFVWRSTILEPQDLLPSLQFIGLPWSFWPDAQPSLALIEQTRDFRLDSESTGTLQVGLWWKYILAAQVTYNLLPRSIMLLIARQTYLRRLQSGGSKQQAETQNEDPDSVSSDVTLANLKSTVDSPFSLLAWADIPDSCQEDVQRAIGPASATHRISAIAEELDSEPDTNQSVVIVVKSWEPPLAELGDRLRAIDSSADKLILPLDWNDQGLRTPTAPHLDEWRRFAATLPEWEVLALKGDI